MRVVRRITQDDFFITHIFDIALGGTFLYIHDGLDLFTKVDVGDIGLLAENLPCYLQKLHLFAFSSRGFSPQ